MSKSKARRERKAQKYARENQKNIQFAKNVTTGSTKIPRIENTPFGDLPRLAQSEFNYHEYAFSWELETADKEDSWSWGEPRAWTTEEHKDVILGSLAPRRNNSWMQVRAETYNGSNGVRKNYYRDDIPLEKLDNEARERWLSDETRYLFPNPSRLRVGSKRRIWGFRYKACFYVVWYERNHRIYPLY